MTVMFGGEDSQESTSVSQIQNRSTRFQHHLLALLHRGTEVRRVLREDVALSH